MIQETQSKRRNRVDRRYTPSSKLTRLRAVLAARLRTSTVLGGPFGDCVIWTACLSGNRRPAMKIEGRVVYVARAILYCKLGRGIRRGKVAAHTCDVGQCVNADHLYEATYSRNLRDAYTRGRRPSTFQED